MTFLPIVERELRLAARRRPTHWMRFFAALAAVTLGAVLLVGDRGSIAPPELGRLMFWAISTLAFAFALLAGTFLTADCLCSEKREGTLGLLFLTDLRGHDVVLGKLAATSTVSVYALLAVLPVLGLPLLMGGVSAGEFGRMVLALLVTLWLSLAAGMCASALCRDTRDALLASLAQMIFLTGMLYLAAWCAQAIFKSPLAEWLLLPNPLRPFLRCTDSALALRMGASPYWASVGVIAALGLAQLALATYVLPRSWQEKALAKKVVNGRSRRRLLGAERLRENPFYWLAMRDRFPGGVMRLLLPLLFVVWWAFYFGFLANSHRGTGEALLSTCMLMAYGLHVIVKTLVAVQASRRLGEDRRSGALELLLVTPLSPQLILDGQWRALRRQFRPMLWMLWAMNAAMFLLFVLAAPFGMGSGERWTFGSFFVGGALLLAMDFRALGWAGLAEGLEGKRHHRAVMGALGGILAPPILLVLVLGFLFVPRGLQTGEVNVLHLVWFCAGALVSRIVGTRRRKILQSNFRELAAGASMKELRRRGNPFGGMASPPP